MLDKKNSSRGYCVISFDEGFFNACVNLRDINVSYKTANVNILGIVAPKPTDIGCLNSEIH